MHADTRRGKEKMVGQGPPYVFNLVSFEPIVASVRTGKQNDKIPNLILSK